jgi:predicted MFS family arabinose efflux permease
LNVRRTSVTLCSFTMDKKLPKEVYSIQLLTLFCFASLAALNLLPLFFEHLGGTPRQIGFLIGLFSFASFLTRPLGGWLLSRVEPKKIMLAGLLMILIASALYLAIERLDWLVLFLRIFHGVGFSLFILAALMIVVLMVREDLRTYAIGVVSTGFLIPLLVVPALGEEIIKRYGFFFFFLMVIILAFIPFIIAPFLKFRLTTEIEEDGLASTGFISLLRRRRMFSLFLLAFLFEVALSASFSFVPLLVHEGISLRAGYFYTSLGLTAVLLRLLGGRWLKFWGSSRLLLPALYLLCTGSVLVYLSRSGGMLAFSGIVWGLGTGVLYPHLSALSVEGVRAKDKGKTLSLFASSIDFGFALGPIIFGWLSYMMGVRRAFLGLALVIFLASTGVMLWGRSALVSSRSNAKS